MTVLNRCGRHHIAAEPNGPTYCPACEAEQRVKSLRKALVKVALLQGGLNTVDGSSSEARLNEAGRVARFTLDEDTTWRSTVSHPSTAMTECPTCEGTGECICVLCDPDDARYSGKTEPCGKHKFVYVDHEDYGESCAGTGHVDYTLP